MGEPLDIEDLLAQLERLLLEITASAAEGGERPLTRRYELGNEDVNVTAVLRIGFLDELLPPATPRPPVDHGPMIDVIQSGDGFKVLILLPGIAKDDVKVSLRGGSLFFEITTRRRTYRREIPLGLTPNGVRIRSKVENNSVVEIDFARGAEVVRR